jgi:hypothetical protein
VTKKKSFIVTLTPRVDVGVGWRLWRLSGILGVLPLLPEIIFVWLVILLLILFYHFSTSVS